MKEQNLNKAKLIELILEQVNLVNEQEDPPDPPFEPPKTKTPKKEPVKKPAPAAGGAPAKAKTKDKGKVPDTVVGLAKMIYNARHTGQKEVSKAKYIKAFQEVARNASNLTRGSKSDSLINRYLKMQTGEKRLALAQKAGDKTDKKLGLTASGDVPEDKTLTKAAEEKAAEIIADLPTKEEAIKQIKQFYKDLSDKVSKSEAYKVAKKMYDTVMEGLGLKKPESKDKKGSAKKKSKSSRGGYFLRAFRKKYQSEFKEKYGGTGRDAFNKFYAELDKKGIKIRKDRQFGRRHAEAYDKLHGTPDEKSDKSSKASGGEITEAEFQAIVKGAREKFVRAGSSEERISVAAEALNKLKTANGGKDLDGRQRRKAIYLISRGPGAKVKRSRLAPAPQPNAGAIFQGGGPDLPI